MIKDCIEMPKSLIAAHQEVTLAIDAMYVNPLSARVIKTLHCAMFYNSKTHIQQSETLHNATFYEMLISQ